MNLAERLRRWWKPAEYEDDHPLSEGERDERGRLPSYAEERGKLAWYPVADPPIDPEDELRKK